RNQGRRASAEGTTAARTLETVGASGRLQAGARGTRLVLYPPYQFRAVDPLLTNFHLSRPTLPTLVAPFAGYDHTMGAYREAVEERYRLYSYGDAMAIFWGGWRVVR